MSNGHGRTAALLLPDEDLRSYVLDRIEESGRVLQAGSDQLSFVAIDPVQELRSEDLAAFDVLVTGWRTPTLPRDLAELNDRQRYICHLTGTMRSMVPREFVTSVNWTVTNWGPSISRFVSEMNLALLLGVARRFPECRRAMETGHEWKRNLGDGTSLFGKRIGLYGYGLIAREFHKLIEPFHMQVSVYDPYVAPPDRVSGVHWCDSLEQLFQQSEIVSIHAGLTEETTSSVDFRLLSMLPNDGIVINTARAGIIGENDLLRAVRETELRFGLDVFHQEPLPASSPLLDSPRVLCTPHSAGVVGGQFAVMWKTARENLLRFISGEAVEHQVDEALYDRMT